MVLEHSTDSMSAVQFGSIGALPRCVRGACAELVSFLSVFDTDSPTFFATFPVFSPRTHTHTRILLLLG